MSFKVLELTLEFPSENLFFVVRLVNPWISATHNVQIYVISLHSLLPSPLVAGLNYTHLFPRRLSAQYRSESEVHPIPYLQYQWPYLGNDYSRQGDYFCIIPADQNTPIIKQSKYGETEDLATRLTSKCAGHEGTGDWLQSGSSWPQIGQIRGFFRSDFSAFGAPRQMH